MAEQHEVKEYSDDLQKLFLEFLIYHRLFSILHFKLSCELKLKAVS
jgi:hypothetical protein